MEQINNNKKPRQFINKTSLLEGLNNAKNDQYIIPYDLEISTSTITCKLNITFNVENIGLYFNDFDIIIIG